MLCNLYQALGYSHDGVVQRFRRSWELSPTAADEVFGDMIRFLWINATLLHAGEGVLVSITQPITVIDEMWHTFLLFTRDYAVFCDEYLGRFIHHIPAGDEPELSHERMRAQLEREYALVYKHLGLEALVRWYERYPESYSPERMRELRRY